MHTAAKHSGTIRVRQSADSRTARLALLLLSAALIPAVSKAQARPAGRPNPHGTATQAAAGSPAANRRAPVATPLPLPRPQPVPQPPAPVSLLQQPAQKAQVRLEGSQLSIAADNSSLSQVLRDIGAATGTRIEGLSGDERVFGRFGPGQPREVLSALLEGAGYNVVMIGDTGKGAPRQLILSSRQNGPAGGAVANFPTAQPAPSSSAMRDDDSDTDASENQEAPDNANPGAAPVPQPPPARPSDGAIKTPQQYLEELQRMRQAPGAQTPAPPGQGYPAPPPSPTTPAP